MLGYKCDDFFVPASFEIFDGDVDASRAERRFLKKTFQLGNLAVGTGHVGAVDNDRTQPRKQNFFPN